MKSIIWFIISITIGSCSEPNKYNYWDWDEGLLVTTNKVSTQPEKFEILNNLLNNAPLVSGDLATTIANCAESKQANVKIDINSDKPLYDTVNNIIVWHVWLTFQCNEPDKEVFYSCGIDFFMRDDTRKALVETFRLYGPC